MTGQLTGIYTGPMVTSATLRATHATFGPVRMDLQTGAIQRLSDFTTSDAAALEFWKAVEAQGAMLISQRADAAERRALAAEAETVRLREKVESVLRGVQSVLLDAALKDRPIDTDVLQEVDKDLRAALAKPEGV